MDDEREIFDVTDDEGNTSQVEVLDYFFFNGEEYAVMADYTEEEPAEDEEQEIFFMQVTPLEGDEVEFNPVDDDLSQELFDAYTTADEDDEPAPDEE